MTAELERQPQRMSLPEVLDLTAAPMLRSEFLALRGGPLEMDGSAVQRLGGLCLQVLLSVRLTWDSDGHALKLVSPSEALQAALARLDAACLIEETIG